MSNKYGDINQRTALWAAVDALSHAEPILVLSKYGQSKPLPKNKAKTVKFRRAIPYTVSTTQLEEGVTPAAQNTRFEDVSVEMGQYGAVSDITDLVADMAEDPVLSIQTTLAGEQAAETIEMVTYGVIKGGTNVVYGASTDTARSDVNDPITLNRQRAATRFLKAQRGKKVTKMMGSSPKYGTEPLAPCFLAFGHTDLEADIQDMAGFVPVEKYASMEPLPYECGKVGDVRYILSPLFEPFLSDGSATLNGMVATDATNVDVYPIIVIAAEAYGVVPLKGNGAIEITVLNPDTKSKSDVLGQRGYVGWKAYFAAVRLNEAWMIRIEVGATDLG